LTFEPYSKANKSHCSWPSLKLF